jgi:hypothetical protein
MAPPRGTAEPASPPVGGSDLVGDYLSSVPRVAHPPLGYALTLAAAAFFAVNGTV